MRGRARTGGLYREQDSVYWHYRISVRGRDIRKTTAQTNKKKAEAVLKDVRDRIAAEEAGLIAKATPKEIEAVTIAERLDVVLKRAEIKGLKSIKSIRATMTRLRAHFGATRVVDLTAAMVDDWILARKAAGAKPAHINRGTAILKQAVVPFCLEHGRRVPTIQRLSEKGNVRKGFLYEADVVRLQAELPPVWGEVLEFDWYSGWRRSEITELPWTEIDWTAKAIRLPEDRNKTEEPRFLVLEGPVLALMERRWAARVLGCPLVFHVDGRPLPKDSRKSWYSACRRAGLPYGAFVGRRLHDMRRSATREMVNNGVPEKIAMSVTGHKTRAQFDRYNIVVEADQRAAMAKLWKPLGTGLSNVVPLLRAEIQAAGGAS